MDAGRCLRCGRPFTSGEITGVGILRPRRAEEGGPFVEFVCPECHLKHRLVPHGNGRYAPPGTPPPPAPSDADRRVPWRQTRDTTEATETTATPDGSGTSNGAADEQPDEPSRRASPRTASTAASRASESAAASQPAPSPRAHPSHPREEAEEKARDARREDPDDSILPPDVAGALAALELSAGASAKDIERAFRRLALTCHPDKVAHLDPDFVALAERKFKRLQAARDLLLGS